MRVCDISRSGGGGGGALWFICVITIFDCEIVLYGYEHLIALWRQGHRVAYYARGMVQIFRRSKRGSFTKVYEVVLYGFFVLF